MSIVKSGSTPVYTDIYDDGVLSVKARASTVRDIALATLKERAVEDPFDSGFYEFYPEDITISRDGETVEVNAKLGVSNSSDTKKIKKDLTIDIGEALGQMFPGQRFSVEIGFKRI